MKKIDDFLINAEVSIKKAMKQLTVVGQKGLFVVDHNEILIGALSDGDIRKWVLAGGNLNETIVKIYNKKPHFVSENYQIEEVKEMMLKFLIECIPVVNKELKITNILTWGDVFSNKIIYRKPLDIQVVIMAGGKGSRLDPFTRILPKPLIPIGDKSIIEIIMDKFSAYDIKDFFVSVNHKANMIKSYFEDSSKKAYKIRFIDENKPLGTVGSLKLIKNKLKDTFLVTNCDIIIDADCSEIIKFQEDNNFDMTLVVSCRHFVIPYGVCEVKNGGELSSINEKPGYDYLINTGMYLMKKKLIDLIPSSKYFNMDNLIKKIQDKGYKIGVFPISESAWTDVGQWDEYHKAVGKLGL